MATWYVAPSTHPADGGGNDGTTYAKAWRGWPAMLTAIASINPGDTIYICDTFQFGVGYTANITWTKPGTSSAQITFRGDLVSHAGVFIGARIQSWATTTDNGDGTRWFTTSTTANDKVWVNDPTDRPSGDDPTTDTTARALLVKTASQAACAALAGSYYFDNAADKIYVNPGVYVPTNVYFNAEFQGFNLLGNSYISIVNLKMYGSGSHYGCLTLIRDLAGANNITGIIIDGCDFGFAWTGVAKKGLDDDSTNITVRNCTFHNIATGMYPAYDGGTMSQNYNWTINGNEFWQEAEWVRNIDHWGLNLNDRHAIGFMNMQVAHIYDNYIHNWCGYGVSMFTATDPGRNTNNIKIYRNKFFDLNKDTFENVGIVNSFSNGTGQSSNNQGHEYFNNLFFNIQPNLTESPPGTRLYPASGAAMRPKYSGGADIRSGRPKIYNNQTYWCSFLVWAQRDVTASELSTVQLEVKNNICQALNAGGSHIHLETVAALDGVDSNYNSFYPDAQFTKASTVYASRAAWQAALGFDVNSLTSDPLITTAPPFYTVAHWVPSDLSPTRNAGSNLSGTIRTNDFLQNPLIGDWDIGSFENQVAVLGGGGFPVIIKNWGPRLTNV